MATVEPLSASAALASDADKQGSSSLARRVYNASLSTFLVGADVPTWRQILRDNHHAVEPQFLPRAALITAASIYNSVVQIREARRFGSAVSALAMAPPVIVLGHWCSGLAEVQRLLGLDDRFAFPNLHQVRHPRTFLSTEAWHARLTRWMLPARHPSDGLPLGHDLPEDDEYAVANLTGLSPYIGGLFPRRRAHYISTYLTQAAAPATVALRWGQALAAFARKLTWKWERPLILRSPLHTGRLRLLLNLFPAARFVHVVRDPHAVFRATGRSSWAARVYNRLHRAPAIEASFVLERYTRLYDAFFEDRGLVPSSRFCDVRFEDVVRDPIGALRGIYTTLDLPAFEQVVSRLERARVRDWLRDPEATVEPEPALRRQVASAWRRSFDAWGYPA